MRNTYHIDSLATRSLYLTPPIDFNDPFDCRHEFDWDGIDFENLIDIEVRKDAQYQSKGNVNDYLAQLVSIRSELPENPCDMPEHIEGNALYALNQMGIYCLSAVCDNLLMWSHYADGHRGYVIELDMLALQKSLIAEHTVNAVLEKVLYEEQVFRARIDGINQDWQMRTVLTKGMAWSYEQEFRIISFFGGRRTIQLPADTITGIYLGAAFNMDKDLQTLNSALTRAELQSCHIFKGERATGIYAIDFNRIPILE